MGSAEHLVSGITQPLPALLLHRCHRLNQGNLLKGSSSIDKKTVRSEGIEPIKRVFTLFSFQ